MENLKKSLFLTLFISLFTTATLAQNKEQVRKGPHGGELVTANTGHEVEVCLTPTHKRIDVYLPKGSTDKAPSLAVTFYDQFMNAKTVELKAIEAKDFGPHYQGSLNPWMGSYVGLEVRIPFTSDPPVPAARPSSPGDKNKHP
jgi:hypothetical protein